MGRPLNLLLNRLARTAVTKAAALPYREPAHARRQLVAAFTISQFCLKPMSIRRIRRLTLNICWLGRTADLRRRSRLRGWHPQQGGPANESQDSASPERITAAALSRARAIEFPPERRTERRANSGVSANAFRSLHHPLRWHIDHHGICLRRIGGHGIG